MPVYKLYYFNSRGWAEVSRLMFKVAEVDFEDIRLTREEWPNRKTEMPLQQMPVLEIDGKKYGQSRAVARYLAKTFGLMGSSALDELRINELIDTFQELAIKHVVKVVLEADEEKKKELLGAFIKDNLPIYLDFFEKRLKENNGGNGYFVGNSLTLADLDVYAMMYQMETVFTRIGFSDTFNRPLLKQHYKRVEAVPQIAKWIKERPVTDM